jgi:hypothetical protein
MRSGKASKRSLGKWLGLVALLVLVALPLVHAQGPVPGIGVFNAANYRPFTFFSGGDLPQQVLWNGTCQVLTCDVGQIAFTFWFFWPSHAPTIPAQNTTWEPVYIYVNIGTGNVSQVALRGFHYLWNVIPNGTQTALIFSAGTNRPVITFQGGYHIPQNSYPPIVGSLYKNYEYNYTEVPLGNYPLTDPTPPFNLPNYSYTQLPFYAELAVINTVAVFGVWLLVHAHVRRTKGK